MKAETTETTMNEVKRLVLLAVENKVRIEFLDSKNPEHRELRCQLVSRSYAMLFDDMTLAEMKKEIILALKDKGVNPDKENFESLKKYYTELAG